MFKENSREVSPVERPIVAIVRGKYGDGSISCLQIWMKDFGFAVRGFFFFWSKIRDSEGKLKDRKKGFSNGVDRM